MFFFSDYINNGYRDEFLDILYIICILFSLYTIISKNPVVSIFFLIGLFLSISSYLFFIGLEFIGLSYLLVYVGAVSILFLFILMLINIRISELLSDTYNYLPLAMLSVILFIYILGDNIPNNISELGYNKFENLKQEYFFNYKEDILYVISLNWDTSLVNNTQISSIGNILYTNYSIWLLILSIILLLAMVGTIVITLNKNK
uniref:NADH dehydrogenase subunit 6 n=1 Tax=Blastomyces percursus TaxID=1658174 RepID=UPI00286CF7DF|nr:NADH dehydrogenase subunit 6 [Blastomyces percursus]WMB97444.1 NADH dehydrogenase subunit 6 [Blastomyces percursus]